MSDTRNGQVGDDKESGTFYDRCITNHRRRSQTH